MGNTSSAFGTLAASRLQAMQAGRTPQPKKETETNDSISIEVPEAIQHLITGTDFWIKAKTNRYKKLIREGHLHDLLELAALALTKDNPAHWFAVSAGKKMWERTLDFLQKRRAVLRRAEQIAVRIGKEASERMQTFVYKQIWRGRSVERHAVAAQEIRHDKSNQSAAKLFVYLAK